MLSYDHSVTAASVVHGVLLLVSSEGDKRWVLSERVDPQTFFAEHVATLDVGDVIEQSGSRQGDRACFVVHLTSTREKMLCAVPDA